MARSAQTRKASPRAKPQADVPISVRFPAELRARTERYARAHHVAVASAIRMIVGDRLDELERDASLSRAELWQRAEAWKTAESVVDGTAEEVSWDELRAAHAKAMKRAGTKRASR